MSAQCFRLSVLSELGRETELKVNSYLPYWSHEIKESLQRLQEMSKEF